jgi:5'(3')-deoxyribonucleotidase
MKISVEINKKYLYCDMDGVLFDFEGEPNAMERFKIEKGFFTILKPIQKNIDKLRQLLRENPDDIFILSATPNEQADRDKFVALMNHIPELKVANIIFCRLGEDKAQYLKTPIEESALIDDYSLNLIKWKNAGGFPIKFVNDYDNIVGKHTEYNIPYITTFEQISF